MATQIFTNLVTNPRGGVNASGWTATAFAMGTGPGAPVTVTAISDGPTSASPTSIQAEAPSAAGVVLYSEIIPVPAGTHSMSVSFANRVFSSVGAVNSSVGRRVIWYDQNGEVIPESGPVEITPLGVWVASNVVVVPPAGATSLQTFFGISSENQTNGTLTIQQSATIVVANTDSSTPFSSGYFDGSTTPVNQAYNGFANPNFIGTAEPVSISGTTSVSLDTYSGQACAEAVASSSADAVMALQPANRRWAVSEGELVQYQMSVFSENNRLIRAHLTFYDAGGSVVADNQLSNQKYVTGITNLNSVGTVAAPAGTASVGVTLTRVFSVGPDSAASDVFGATQVFLSNVFTTPFTGDTPDTATFEYEWVGTPNDSVSLRTAAVGLVAYGWNGAPHASTSYMQITVAESTAPKSVASAIPVPVPVPTPGVTPRAFKRLQLIDFSVQGDSTPVDPSDTTGAVGQFTLTVDENEQTTYLVNVPIDLIDPTQGTTRGTMRGVSSNDGVTTITADSRMALLTVNRQAQPFVGTLEDAFRYYLELCGITTGIVVDPSIADREVTYLGWNGIVWDRIKELCVAERVETSLVSNNIVLRPLRERTAENYRDSSRSWGLDTSQLARSIEINYYNKEYVVDGLMYPTGGWKPEVPIISVPAGETITETLEVNASLTSIQQPVPQLFVAENYESSSVYTVIGKDGLPIPVDQWVAGGGSVSVEIAEDTRSIILTVTGMAETEYAPYRLALSSGDSTFYSTLRLVGTGVVFDKKTLTMATSVDPDRVSQEVAPLIDNEYIDTEDEARHIGLWALKRWGAARHTISVSTTGINRLGDTGSYAYPVIEAFNEKWSTPPGQLIEDFNLEWAGKTIADFNKYWFDTVKDDFANQAFGNIEGARVKDRDAYFRIRSGTVSPYGVNYSAEEDTTIADFNAVWAGMLIEDFNAEWIGERAQDFSTAPLRRNNG